MKEEILELNAANTPASRKDVAVVIEYVKKLPGHEALNRIDGRISATQTGIMGIERAIGESKTDLLKVVQETQNDLRKVQKSIQVIQESVQIVQLNFQTLRGDFQTIR